MPSPQEIEQALKKVRDQRSFLRELLRGALEWPVPDQIESLGDISYDWSESELRAEGLDKHLTAGTISQLQPLRADQPWGIFLLEFKNQDAFISGRGMTGPLRKVLRGLLPKKRAIKNANLKSFHRENLLFICTYRYEHYRVAYFKAPSEETKTAPLAAFGWGPDEPARTACEFNLPDLIWPDRSVSPADWTARWAAAFDVEKVTKRFYEQYADTFASVEKTIGKENNLSGESLRMFTQSLFNRLMFLRFIERKGWLVLHNRRDYLRALHEAGPVGNHSLYRSRVYPLFFEGLSIQGHKDSDAIGEVPFLNGGLFEVSDLDDRVKDIPDDAFAPIIGRDGLFYRFNFTVEESTRLDIEVAVDPEMLGKVFEELVTGRHESGSFYTPRPIVSFMCREALARYLADKTVASPDAITALVDQHEIKGLNELHAKQILEALDSIKAVDPACGSGAYLLGLLQELIGIRRALQSEKLAQDPNFLYGLKLHIISHNLYGVDIDRFATNIAKLRLWLSLAVEADKPLPLPNLDFKIETGDSLRGIEKTVFNDKLFHQLEILKPRYFGESATAKKTQLKRQIDDLIRELTNGKETFDFEIYFSEVFHCNGGFDLVIANPPYLNSRAMAKDNPELRELIKGSYSMTKGSWDIYIAFFEKGFRLLGKQGVLSFITPDKWISKPFGDELRSRTREGIFSILKFGRSVFESVNVDAIVSVFTVTPQPLLRIYDFVGTQITLKRIVGKDTLKPPFAYDWLFSDHVDLLAKIEAQPRRLSALGNCENACATDDAYRLREFIQEEAKENRREDFLRIINTGTIGKYFSKWGQRQMVYLGSKYARPTVNRRRFLEAFPNSYGKKSVQKKLIVKGLNLLDACLDADGTTIPGIPTLLVASQDLDTLKILLAIINSPIAFFYMKQKYPASSYNQGTTFTKEMINDLPFPELSTKHKSALISGVDHILGAKQADPSTDTTVWERDLNALIYDLYGLSTADSIKIEAPRLKS